MNSPSETERDELANTAVQRVLSKIPADLSCFWTTHEEIGFKHKGSSHGWEMEIENRLRKIPHCHVTKIVISHVEEDHYVLVLKATFLDLDKYKSGRPRKLRT